MKSYFFIITIVLKYKIPEGNIRSTKLSETGLIVVEDNDGNNPSLIYYEALKKVCNGRDKVEVRVIFFNYWEEKDAKKKKLSNEKMSEILNRPIIGLDVNVATLKKLQKCGFETWRDIVSMTENGLQLLDFSEMDISNIKEALGVFGLKLAK